MSRRSGLPPVRRSDQAYFLPELISGWADSDHNPPFRRAAYETGHCAPPKLCLSYPGCTPHTPQRDRWGIDFLQRSLLRVDGEGVARKLSSWPRASYKRAMKLLSIHQGADECRAHGYLEPGIGTACTPQYLRVHGNTKGVAFGNDATANVVLTG